MWKALLCILTVVMVLSCAKDEEPTIPVQEELSIAEKYLLEISLGSEFGGPSDILRKWAQDIEIYLVNPEVGHLVEECEKVIDEINALSSSIRLRRVENQEQAEFVIFFSDGDTYVNHEPNAKNHVAGNRGLVWIYWNGRSEINRGSMYVDITQVLDQDCQKHLLREELTQGLGLLNDSFKYSESIFQQNWTCSPSYAEIDRELLKIFLNEDVRPGMTRLELENYLRSN